MTGPPRLLVFAGPNGSGKTTIARAWAPAGIYINADDIKLATDCSDLEAAQTAEQIRKSCLAGRLDFTFETVLSTDRNLRLLRTAQDVGYKITGVFVMTVSAELNVARVMSRTAAGGHSVPADKTRSRYAGSLANLPEFARLCDEVYVFDNTDQPTVVFTKAAEDESFYPTEMWPAPTLDRLLDR
ncbi:MAG: zeta toxin family protein [Bifidobacteriaceae bacterium]|jgi:predicted ABC-type ATPase|nr:zeta toxin family protein [Bifidobacteriaceae bacterium]